MKESYMDMDRLWLWLFIGSFGLLFLAGFLTRGMPSSSPSYDTRSYQEQAQDEALFEARQDSMMLIK